MEGTERLKNRAVVPKLTGLVGPKPMELGAISVIAINVAFLCSRRSFDLPSLGILCRPYIIFFFFLKKILNLKNIIFNLFFNVITILFIFYYYYYYYYIFVILLFRVFIIRFL